MVSKGKLKPIFFLLFDNTLKDNFKVQRIRVKIKSNTLVKI